MATKGSCLCGKTTYQFTGEPTMTGICHCLTCRKLTGSTYLTFATVPSANFTFTADPPRTMTFTHEAGVDLHVSSCQSCGVALCKSVEGTEEVIVFAGTLGDGGDAIGMRPKVELWTKYRVGWCGDVGKGEMFGFEGFPPPATSSS